MATAFAPGHVSGLFAVHDEDPDPLKKGSRGAGWSVEKGATATVAKASAPSIAIDGRPADAPVTRAALERLAPGVPLAVELRLDLPVKQGFGMSAAGTLAACLAAASELGLDPEDALRATHAAEVLSGTGLGDAVGSWHGNGEVRIRPGCPPDGWAMRVDAPENARFLFLVAGAGIATPTIIRDAAWKRKTRELADPAVDRILAAGRPMAWTTLLHESQRFTKGLGLLPAELAAAAEALPPGALWGQSMLGTTLWVTGRPATLEAARKALAGRGTLLELGVDARGARLVRG
jgi:pantoate kinase